jgi:long-chain fatty acid transport protein
MLIACAAAFSAGSAIADEFHYTNLPIGDRASGMGGAYTAVSDDATGLYYNPAGIVYSEGRSISASVNAYYNTTKTYKSVIGGNGWVRESSSLLPNYFGVIQPVGRLKVGISYAVPESIMSDQQQTFSDLQLNTSLQSLNPGVRITTYIINFNDEGNTYNFGPSIAAELTDGLSAGLTLYYFQRKSLRILNQLIKTSNGGSELTNDYFHSEESGLRPVLGFMFSPVTNVSFGLALSKYMVMSSNTTFQHTSQRRNVASWVDVNNNGIIDPGEVVTDVSDLPDGQKSMGAKRRYPTQISLGGAWFPSASVLLTADVSYYERVNQQIATLDGQSVLLRSHANAVTNFALGAEYYLTRNWAMRAGLYSDFANTQKIDTGASDQSEHIDIYGVTASVSHFTRNTAVTLGGGVTRGKGQSQIIGGTTAIQTAVSESWMLFLSSSYSY